MVPMVVPKNVNAPSKYFHPIVKTAMKYVHAQCPFPEKDGQDGPKICTSNA